VASVLAASEESKPLRLLWLIDSLTMGGAESLVIPFAREFARRGEELIVCCLKTIDGNPIERELTASGVRTINLQSRNLRDVAAFRRLLALIRSEQIDVIHAHLTYASIWTGIASRLTGVPAVATLHVITDPQALWRDRIRAWLMAFVLRAAGARVIAVSRRVRDSVGSRFGRTIRVIHNGINASIFRRSNALDAFRVRREFGFAAGTRVLATVSVLREGKGLEILIDAFAELHRRRPDTRLLVVGDGSLRSALELRAGNAEVVRFAGTRRDVPTLLAGADLFILPSLEDAFPTVVLEAMAAGLPVIATRSGGIPEIVDEGVTGQLVPPANPKALADAIENLLEDHSRCERMGQQGRQRIEWFFSIGVWVDALSDVYRNSRRRIR
jgi:glycosyltransferase involved in cell wall biosynthesis